MLLQYISRIDYKVLCNKTIILWAFVEQSKLLSLGIMDDIWKLMLPSAFDLGSSF
jgi:hypothetical protein